MVGRLRIGSIYSRLLVSIRGLIPLFASISSLPALAMCDIGFIRGLDVPVLALPAPIRGLIQKNSQFFEKLSKELNPTAEIR
jgi:hypothetical protein